MMIAVALTNAVAEETGTPPAIELPRWSSRADINIDGRLDEPIWQQAAILTAFTQREPHIGQPASESTRVFVAYDEKYLYIAAEMHDREPHRVVANVMRRDAELQDNDSFEVFLDTFHDHRNLFYFATNALGAQRDGLIRNEGDGQNWDWDGVWESAGRRTPDGWTAEIVIPFKTLRFNGDARQTWGANFSRRIPRKREESYWAPVARDLGFSGRYKPASYGHLHGLSRLHQGGALEVKPFTVTGGTKDFEEIGKPLTHKLELGGDAKVHLTANLTTDLTFNTDFAQVESDQEQVNLTRFGLFFPEKREFFLENADIFRIGERSLDFEIPNTLLFFSRQIGLTEDGKAVPIIGGAKTTGKVGKYEVGILEVLTDRTRYVNDDDEAVDLPRRAFTVVRAKRDILSKSSIGMMATSKDPWDDTVTRDAVTQSVLSRTRERNRVFAGDLDLSWGRNTRLNGFLGKSQTTGVHGNDWAGTAFLSHEVDRWGINASYTDIQENFDAQLGFIQRTDIRKARGLGYVSHRWSFGPVRQTFFFNDFQYITDQHNDLQSRFLFSGLFNLFRNGSEFFMAMIGTYDVITEAFDLRDDGASVPPAIYSFRTFLFEFQSDRSRRLAVTTRINTGGFYNGTLTMLSGGLIIRPNANLSVEADYTRNNIDLPTPRGRYATNLAIARLAYSFTPRLFAKVFVQYNDDSQTFRTNFLLNWIHRPGSNLYLVYNEEEETAPWRERNRTVLAKLNYLIGW